MGPVQEDDFRRNLPFFDALDLSVKEKIAAEFIYEFSHEYGTDVSIDDIRIASMLSEMFRFVNHFRNICAHDDRLFNTVAKNGSKIPRIVLFHKKQPPLFKSRLFDCVIILGFFLTKKDYRTLILQIEHNIDHLSKKLSPNTFNAVLIHMGFPKNGMISSFCHKKSRPAGCHERSTL